MPLKNMLVQRGKASLSMSFWFLATGGGQSGRRGKASISKAALHLRLISQPGGYTSLQSEHSGLSTRDGNASTFYTHVICLQWSSGEGLPCPLL